eukprot:CAMPEP_0196134620 /NCGR_PEP_ID=MMETSP0910-20130528/3482_1 /TAXON_ID=49265 /ORGANISM="Thalassiosira rotula, Strain GSO102" /LENGTH=74 /DNA_ID=CAMNT_0041394589 /DNA_START=585 /DNA_END=809 /DNA_ORIENTATION=+
MAFKNPIIDLLKRGAAYVIAMIGRLENTIADATSSPNEFTFFQNQKRPSSGHASEEFLDNGIDRETGPPTSSHS